MANWPPGRNAISPNSGLAGAASERTGEPLLVWNTLMTAPGTCGHPAWS
jgi:hypothetical protein